jgi:5'-nucleotidase/UDP-sugar diphosphatase
MRSVLACGLIVLVTALATPARAQRAPKHITILHINDTHSHLSPFGPKDRHLDGTIGGYAKLATVLAEQRARAPSALFVHAGDVFDGSAHFSAELGVAELQLLASLRLDAMVLGNHELGYGPDFLAGVLATAFPTGAPFPIVTSNLDIANTPNLAPFITTASTGFIKVIDGVKIGFFGLTTDRSSALPAPAVIVDETQFARIATESVQALRAQGARVVIALTHIGLDPARALISKVAGIDVVIGGHDHVLLTQPELVPASGGGTTILVEAGEFTKNLGRLELEIGDRGVSLVDYESIAIDRGVAPAPAIARVIRQLEGLVAQRFGDVFHRPLALAIGALSNNFDPDSQIRDTPVGDLFADAYRAFTGTDIAIEVRGLLDDGLPAGVVVPADIFDINSTGVPAVQNGALVMNPNHLATFEVTGAALVALFEAAIGSGDLTNFPQISGMRFDYKSQNPLGHKVVVGSVRIHDRPLDPARVYSVTVNSRVVFALPQFGVPVQNLRDVPDLAVQVVSDAVARRRILFPISDGRMRDLSVPAHRH